MVANLLPPQKEPNLPKLRVVENTNECYEVGIYLLKEQEVDNARKELLMDRSKRLSAQIKDGFIIEFNNDEDIPEWLNYIKPLLLDENDLVIKKKTASAALWIPCQNRTFILAFGYAHSRIKPDWVEPQFGRSVALSIIPKDKGFSSISVNQVFAKQHKTDEKSPKYSELNAFNFNPNRDLVQAVAGEVEELHKNQFGEKVRGGPALKIRIDFADLLTDLKKILEIYESCECENRYPVLHYLMLVKDKKKAAHLDEKLNEKLKNNLLEIVVCFPQKEHSPEDYPSRFEIGRKNKEQPTTYQDLFLVDWKKHIEEQNFDSKKLKIHAHYENNVETEESTFYDCICAEIGDDNKTYVLYSGAWYKAHHDYIKIVNDKLSNINKPDYCLIDWSETLNEGSFNKEACERSNMELTLFDAKNISYGGGQSKFEFCGLMHLKSKTLYFVKNVSGSSSASHLCEQAKCTAENFFSPDGNFKVKLKRFLQKENQQADTTWLESRPKKK